jgi:hypothetical protein
MARCATAIGLSLWQHMQSDADDILECAKGSRCRLSELGIAANPRATLREGTILGRGRSANNIRVLFDGLRTPISLHKKYIELISSVTR